jgi:hypothetical protein
LILTGAAALLLLVSWGGGPDQRVSLAQAEGFTVEQRIIIRVPRTSSSRGIATRPVAWREGRRQRCIAARRIVGAGLLGPNSVDLILSDQSRVRATLGRRCPALDFYRGFYVTSSDDGRICADRDTIRARSGAECEIDQFRVLIAETQ